MGISDWLQKSVTFRRMTLSEWSGEVGASQLTDTGSGTKHLENTVTWPIHPACWCGQYFLAVTTITSTSIWLTCCPQHWAGAYFDHAAGLW
jgi:hypothetical protein